jgi:hypothetical protein
MADIQVWWIKRTVRGRRSHSIHHGLNQSTMAVDRALTPTVVQLEKKSCITADDDPLHCKIYFSRCARKISNYGRSNEPREAYEATAFPMAQIIVPWQYIQRKHQRRFGFRRKIEAHPVKHTPCICPQIIFKIYLPGYVPACASFNSGWSCTLGGVVSLGRFLLVCRSTFSGVVNTCWFVMSLGNLLSSL